MLHGRWQRPEAAAEVARWATEATGSAQMLHRRCQSAGAGLQWRDGSLWQRLQDERSIADVNVLEPGRCGAMGHKGAGRHERFIADVNVPSRVTVVRWATAAKV